MMVKSSYFVKSQWKAWLLDIYFTHLSIVQKDVREKLKQGYVLFIYTIYSPLYYVHAKALFATTYLAIIIR